ncbi:MAG TPA: c-type cytochrome [Bryobacteraceae bacterium]|nr:c-type cytochrome [Bryobacteraceae bacterium]
MFWVFLLLAQAAAPQQNAVQSQIERGQALFFDAENGCGNCHALKGKGTAVGPDLKGIARLSPAGIVTAIRSTVTQYVQTAKVKGAGSFPAMPPAGTDKSVKIYDLSKMPPEAHDVDRDDISLSPNNNWKHPPSLHKFTDAQLADVICYIRYAGAGTKAAVDPEDMK